MRHLPADCGTDLTTDRLSVREKETCNIAERGVSLLMCLDTLWCREPCTLKSGYRTTANVSYTVNIQTPLFQRVFGTMYLKYRAIV
jgi:hypothetical protein